MMKNYLLPFVLLLMMFSCKKKHESAEVLEREKDSLRLFNKIVFINDNSGGDNSLILKRMDSLIPELKSKNFDFHLLKICQVGSYYSYNLGDTIRKKKYLQEVDKIASKKKDTIIQALSNYIKGVAESYDGNRNKSSEYFFRAIKLFNKKDSATYYNTLGKLAEYSMEVSDYESALTYQMLIHQRERKKNGIRAGFSYGNIAEIYYYKKDLNMLQKYIDSLEKVNDTINHKTQKIPVFYYKRSLLALLKGENFKALQLLNKERAFKKSVGIDTDYEIDIAKMVAFEKIGMIDSIHIALKNLKPKEKLIIADKDVAKNYFPIKVKYSSGNEQKESLEKYVELLRGSIDENKGYLAQKYRLDLQKEKDEKVFRDKINKQKRNNLILIFVSAILGLILMNIIFYLSNKRNKLESNNKELKLKILNTKFEAIIKERNRISKELHDDLGATFTSISMATQMLKDFPEKNDKYLEVISNNSNRMSEKVNEIVWSLNSRNDNLGSLSAYIINFAKKFFEPTSIHLNIETDKTIEENHEKFVAADKRRMIFLTAKEILNNIMKHADAKNVVMKLIFEEPNKFSIKIKDDGKGIKLPKNHSGNGLKNIAENIDNIKGECSYQTSEQGTEFLISVKI